MKTLKHCVFPIIFATLAHGQLHDHKVSLSHMTSNGKSTIHSISEAEASKLAEWNPTSGAPAPLSVADAIKEGRKWMLANNPKFDDFEARSITLQKMGLSSLKHRWYYKIDFDATVGGQKLFGSQFTAVILFDGKVVEPVVRDAE